MIYLTTFKNLFRTVLFSLAFVQTIAADRPNIILTLAADLGYGDGGCYDTTALKTPNMDGLAKQGVRFTDAHATSATCTPSRDLLLTGKYAWRQKGTEILRGDAALIIKPGRTFRACRMRVSSASRASARAAT
jgi:arylsulfatase A